MHDIVNMGLCVIFQLWCGSPATPVNTWQGILVWFSSVFLFALITLIKFGLPDAAAGCFPIESSLILPVGHRRDRRKKKWCAHSVAQEADVTFRNLRRPKQELRVARIHDGNVYAISTFPWVQFSVLSPDALLLIWLASGTHVTQ